MFYQISRYSIEIHLLLCQYLSDSQRLAIYIQKLKKILKTTFDN